jgi:hypothetical protein
LLTPLIIYAYQSFTDYKRSNNLILARNAIDKLGQAVDWVFVQGFPARIEIEIYLPEGIEKIQLVNRTILLVIDAVQVTYTTLGNVSGELPTTFGYHRVRVEAFETNVTVSV